MLLRWIETRPVSVSFPFFLCNQAPTTEIYTLSLHDALPIYTSYMHTLAQRGLTNNDNSGTSFYVVLSSTPSFVNLGRQPGDTFARNPFVPSNPVQTAALMKNNEDVYRFIGGANVQWDAVQTSRHYLRLVTLGVADFFTQQNALFFPPELQFEPNDGLPGTSLLSNSNNLNLNLNASAVHTYTP